MHETIQPQPGLDERRLGALVITEDQLGPPAPTQLEARAAEIQAALDPNDALPNVTTRGRP